MPALRIDERSPFRRLIGVGGIGSGIFFQLEGNHTLGRNESRPAHLLDVRDYCKLHIVIHYVAKLLGANQSGSPFHVLPVGKVGNDAAGRQMLKEMSEAGMDLSCVQTANQLPTLFSVCFQYPDGTGGNITTSRSAAASLCESDIDEIEGLLKANGERTIAVAAPEVSLEVRDYFLHKATEARAFRAASFVLAEIGSAKKAGMLSRLDMLALNEEEAAELLGLPFSASQPLLFVQKCQEFVHSSCPRLRMVVSVGKDGAYGITAESWNYCRAPQVDVASTAGAGDSLLGGILAGIAAGLPFVREQSNEQAESRIGTALGLGVLLASYKCQSPHTIHPLADIASLSMFAVRGGYQWSSEIEQLLKES